MYSPISIFQTKKWLVPTQSKRLLNLKQTSEERIPILDEVPNVQRLHISHLLILELLPEINQDQCINSKSVKAKSISYVNQSNKSNT